MTEELRDKVHIFSSSFYTLYSTDANFLGWKDEKKSAVEKRYERVQGLENNVNIFNKDFLVFPCLDNEHWFLTIVTFPRQNGDIKNNSDEDSGCATNGSDDKPQKPPMILCFDSVRANPARRTTAIKHIRNFLDSEYQAKYRGQFAFTKSDFVGGHVSSPQQKNATDCGLFVMEFVEHFFLKDPIHDFSFPIDRSEWFHPKIIESHEKREQVANIIKSMTAKDIPLPPISFNDEDSQEVEFISETIEAKQPINDNNNNNEEKTDKEDDQENQGDFNSLLVKNKSEKMDTSENCYIVQAEQDPFALDASNKKMRISSSQVADIVLSGFDEAIEVPTTTQNASSDVSNKKISSSQVADFASSGSDELIEVPTTSQNVSSDWHKTQDLKD